jgi:CDP-glycerol glycerophosphotransferase (TagB/SpsB family)
MVYKSLNTIIICKFFLITIFLILNSFINLKKNVLFSLFRLFKGNLDIKEIYFNYKNLLFSFSYKFNITEIKYNIYFYDKNNNIIKPSDLTLFYNLHIICHMNYENNLISVDSLANIIDSKKFQCVEYFNINETINFGIKIYLGENYSIIKLFDTKIIKYERKYEKNDKFNPFFIEKNFLNMYYNNSKNQTFNLSGIKQFFIEKPNCSSKERILSDFNKWEYKNIYNNFFCFCKGSCLYKDIPELCKYHFYLYIIDNNKFLYNKTDYLFADFFYGSSDDTFPVFQEMIKRNLSVHYMDTKKNIYNQFCNNEKYCLKVINKINKIGIIDADFLENYLDLILKLKAAICGHEFDSLYNIFYNIDYLTYINLGHGIKYFKYFSYKDYSSFTKYNKLVLPPSDKIISVAKKYGWEDKNIIKICLPKYDKYNIDSDILKKKNKEKSIFIMFTWRYLLKGATISIIYVKNILALINDINLNKVLSTNNITLYFGLHPNFEIFRKRIKINKYIKYIKQKNISECLMKTNLLISDFSSIIFDMIYQKKPIVLFIPDAYDFTIKNLYRPGYCDIINSLKNGSIYLENLYFNIKDTINKTIFYINNNFKLEKRLKIFYDSFQLNCTNNTNKFINYLINNL